MDHCVKNACRVDRGFKSSTLLLVSMSTVYCALVGVKILPKFNSPQRPKVNNHYIYIYIPDHPCMAYLDRQKSKNLHVGWRHFSVKRHPDQNLNQTFGWKHNIQLDQERRPCNGHRNGGFLASPPNWPMLRPCCQQKESMCGKQS